MVGVIGFFLDGKKKGVVLFVKVCVIAVVDEGFVVIGFHLFVLCDAW